jgi:N-acetylneuraminic acid mutarotase
MMRQVLGVSAACIALGTILANAQPQNPPGNYTTKAPLPAARNETTAAVVNGKIYVIGGNFPSKQYDVAVNEEYDPTTNTWRTRAPMPSGLNHIGSAALNGKIYIVGGFTSNGHKGVKDSVFEYDVASDTWKSVAPLSSPRGSGLPRSSGPVGMLV